MTENIRDWMPLIVFVFVVVSLEIILPVTHYPPWLSLFIILTVSFAGLFLLVRWLECIHMEVPEMRSYLRAIGKIRISGVFQSTSSISRKEITHVPSMFSDVLVLAGERRRCKIRRFKGWMK